MRRIGRWMVNALTALSLLLCVGMCVLWVRSYSYVDSMSYHRFVPMPGAEVCHQWVFYSRVGGLCFERYTYTCVPGTSALMPHFLANSSAAGAYPPFFGTRSSIPGRDHFTIWQRVGFDFQNSADNSTPPFITQGVIVPHWFFAAVVGLPGVVGARRLVRLARLRRRAAQGRCLSCSYDLAGNVSGVCPECGRKIANSA